MIVSPTTSEWRRLPWPREALLYPLAVGLGLVAAYGVLTDRQLIKVALLLPAAVVALGLPAEKLFAGWLFFAPLVQGAAGGQDRGHIFFVLLFFAPPLALVARLAIDGVRSSNFSIVDALPALYLGYILVRVELIPSQFSGTEASWRGIYAAVGVAVVAYYFAAFGKTSERFPELVARSLLAGGITVASFALVEAATGWNLWHQVVGGNGELRRVVATFTSPAALGTYLGACVVFAAATLIWRGPRSLRPWSVLLIVISLPALYLTYTRGPILGAAVVVVVMALLANRARWQSLLLLATVAVLIFAAWSHITSSTIYKERFGVTQTISTREGIQHESVDLFRQKPIFGWGYNTFDQVKLTLHNIDLHIKLETSHDTYLTVLVELGVVGLALLVIPWLVISYRVLRASRAHSNEAWIIAACIGTTVSFAIAAFTYDARFFGLTTALPWMALGLARGRVWLRPEASKSERQASWATAQPTSRP
jgi:O-antigen ligase